MPKDLRDWIVGDGVLNNAHHQLGVEAIRELQQLLRAGADLQFGVGSEWGIGKIVDRGPALEADRTSAQYWIQRQFIPNTIFRGVLVPQEDTTEAALEIPGDPREPSVIVATNLPELTTNSHTLPLGELVLYWVVQDKGDPISHRHYVFSRIPDTGLIAKITSITASAGAKYGGVSMTPPAADVSSSGDATAADLGTAASDTLVILDTNEIGRASSSHLNHTGTYHHARLLRVNSDGRLIVAIESAPGPNVRFDVSVSQTSGSAGTASTVCDFVYTVTARNGETLGTGQAVTAARPKGKMIAGVTGTAYYTAGGTLVLYRVDEYPDTFACS